jgi:hypothetical protein
VSTRPPQPRGVAGITGHHVYVTFPVPAIRMPA